MISPDDNAIHLAELEIKRNRTLADLDTIREARRSTWESLRERIPGEGKPVQDFMSALQPESLPEPANQELHTRWRKALASSSPAFHELVEEWQGFKAQEGILLRMLNEIEEQIATLRKKWD